MKRWKARRRERRAWRRVESAGVRLQCCTPGSFAAYIAEQRYQRRLLEFAEALCPPMT